MKNQSEFSSYFILAIIFVVVLIIINKSREPENIENQTLPNFSTQELYHADQTLTSDDLKGKVSLLVVWASWCPPCRIENPVLLQIAQNYHVPIFGIDYKDGSDAAKAWLAENGNPFTKIGKDNSGLVAEDLGVYGTPTIFLIDKTGTVRYIHVGVLENSEWENTLYPLVKKYQSS